MVTINRSLFCRSAALRSWFWTGQSRRGGAGMAGQSKHQGMRASASSVLPAAAPIPTPCRRPAYCIPCGSDRVPDRTMPR